MDTAYNNRVAPELADVIALQTKAANGAGQASNHFWADNNALVAAGNGSFANLVLVPSFTVKVTGKLRIMVSAVFENANNLAETVQLGIGYAPHLSPTVEQYTSDVISLAANGGAGTQNGGVSVIWVVTGLALNTPLDIAAMGKASATLVNVIAHSCQIDIQEIA